METLDTHLAAFAQWLLRATLQGSLLVCLILALKLALRERLPARWHYCLWLILLVRLALPWAPQSRLSIYTWSRGRSRLTGHSRPGPARRLQSPRLRDLTPPGSRRARGLRHPPGKAKQRHGDKVRPGSLCRRPPLDPGAVLRWIRGAGCLPSPWLTLRPGCGWPVVRPWAATLFCGLSPCGGRFGRSGR